MKINNDLYEYNYDNLYNITDIYLNNKLINHYEYDNFNELIKEDNYLLNKTIRYTYDNAGNILRKQEYEIDTYNLLHTDTYEYNNANWEDQLTKYNNETITYDAIGNPLTIGNKTLSWKNGRQLASYIDENLNITYDYNKDGVRIRKKINNTITNYFTENNKILFEKTGNNMVYYIRDEEGSLIGFKDNETKLYYLNSRYYNPEWGRFINADGIINGNLDFIGHNLYAYVSNNMVNFYDNTGIFFKKVLNNIKNDISRRITAGTRLLSAAASYMAGKLLDLPISSSLFNKSMYNSNSKINKQTEKNLKNKIQNSTEMKKIVDDCLNQKNANIVCSGSVNFQSDTDLAYSVGRADYIIKGKYNYITNTKYLEITISDKYDFGEGKYPSNSIKDIANAFGTYYQEKGFLIPYTWDITYYQFYQ